jgi:hypothetical protein
MNPKIILAVILGFLGVFLTLATERPTPEAAPLNPPAPKGKKSKSKAKAPSGKSSGAGWTEERRKQFAADMAAKRAAKQAERSTPAPAV